MKNFRKPLLKFLFLLIAVFCLCEAHYLWRSLKGVAVNQLSRTLSELPQNSFSLSPAFLQPYYYHGKGSQFYVFFSEDRQYVLKIPRASKMKEGFLDRVFLRKIRKSSVLRSMQIAENHLAFETRLIHAHYGKTSQIYPMLTIYDGLRRSWTVDLNDIPFALQRRCPLMGPSLEETLDPVERKHILLAYLRLLEREKNLGWMSEDSAFWLNFGYDRQEACRIDIGSYVALDHRFSYQKAAKPLVHWLKKNDPVLLKWFESQLNDENVSKE